VIVIQVSLIVDGFVIAVVTVFAYSSISKLPVMSCFPICCDILCTFASYVLSVPRSNTWNTSATERSCGRWMDKLLMITYEDGVVSAETVLIDHLKGDGFSHFSQCEKTVKHGQLVKASMYPGRTL
jgi:hypothetical protein